MTYDPLSAEIHSTDASAVAVADLLEKTATFMMEADRDARYNVRININETTDNE